MCEPVSIGMAIVAVAGAAMSASSKAKAEGAAEDARRLGQREQVIAMNRADNDMKLETVDKNDEARAQLTETNLTALRNRGTIRAAIGESGLEGNTMDRLQNAVENESSANKVAILDNYDRDYATIFQNRVANVEQTKANLRGSTSAVRGSKIADALNIVSAGVGGAAAGSTMSSAMKSSKGTTTTTRSV